MHFLQCLGQKQFKKYCFEFEEAEEAAQGTSATEAKNIMKAWTRQLLYVALLFWLILSIPVLNFAGHWIMEEIGKLEASSEFKVKKLV